jgi:hypothetical protein
MNAEALAAVNNSTRKQLDDVTAKLSDLSVAQESGTRGSKGETARQRALRLSLRRSYMTPIAELAKFKLRDVPEFAALMLPPGNATAERSVAAAYAMADAATPHAQVFTDNGLPATFADDLRNAAAAVGESIAGRDNHQGRRAGATAGLQAEQQRGRSILRILNALIMAHIGNDAQLTAEWVRAKLVRRKPGPAAGSEADTPQSGVTPITSGGTSATTTPILSTTPTSTSSTSTTPSGTQTHIATPAPTPAVPPAVAPPVTPSVAAAA